jgi:hypothetical protein
VAITTDGAPLPLADLQMEDSERTDISPAAAPSTKRKSMLRFNRHVAVAYSLQRSFGEAIAIDTLGIIAQFTQGLPAFSDYPVSPVAAPILLHDLSSGAVSAMDSKQFGDPDAHARQVCFLMASAL